MTEILDPALDPTAAALAAPVRLPVASLTHDDLVELGLRVLARSEEMHLTRWFWGEGVLLAGVLELCAAMGDPVPAWVSAFIDDNMARGIQLAHVNNLAPGAAAADLGRADVTEQLLAWLEAPGGYTLALNGAIEHWPGGVWADTAYMAGTFLVHEAYRTSRPELAVRAAEQWLAHAETLQHPVNHLMAHGSHAGETIWCHWGRANAWLALAATEVVEAASRLFDGSEAGERLSLLEASITSRLTKQLDALVACQPVTGVWDVLVDGHPETRGIVETSAAAGIAAALLRAHHLGLGEGRYRDAAWLTLRGLAPYVAADGTLEETSAGTILQLIPFGYSVIRSDHIQPWGQGLALRALAAAITDLDTDLNR